MFVLFVVLTLALGIGANTTVFTVINTLILNPLPVPDSSGLVALAVAKAKSTSKSSAPLPISYADLKDYQARNGVFRSLAGYTSPRGVTWQADSASQGMFSELVTGNYFSTLGLSPVRGRFFLPEEDSAPGAHPVAVMNYGTWQGRFGGAADIIGKTLRLNNVVFTVIGIAPPQFIGVNAMFGPDLWIPPLWRNSYCPMRCRMRSAIAAKRFSGEWGDLSQESLGRRRKPISRPSRRIWRANIRPPMRATRPRCGPSARSCSPSTGRHIHADSVRQRRTVDRRGNRFADCVLECGKPAACALSGPAAGDGGPLGDGSKPPKTGASTSHRERVSWLSQRRGGIVHRLCGSAPLVRSVAVICKFRAPKLDATVFVFALFISLATGFLFGTIPAFKASRASVAETLKEEARTTGRSRKRVTLANALLVGQVAFSFLLLVTAALFLRSIGRAYNIDPGFQTAHLAVFMTNPGQAGYGKPQTKAFYKDVRERVARIPGVESVSWASNMPLWARSVNGLQVEGRQQRSQADEITTIVNTVDRNYFETAGVAIDSGREFTNHRPGDLDSR